MTMSNDEAIFVPAFGYDETQDPTVFAKFDPSTTLLAAGFQTTPQFAPLPVDIVFERDTAVTLRDGTAIYVDVFRPAGNKQVRARGNADGGHGFAVGGERWNSGAVVVP